MKLVNDSELMEDIIITFPSGLIGFENQKEYSLCEVPGQSQFCRLFSKDKELTLLLLNPFAVFPDYDITITDEDRAELSLTEPENAFVLNTVTIPADDAEQITINLAAPIIINIKNRIGRQVILLGDYPVKQPLVAQRKRACCG